MNREQIVEAINEKEGEDTEIQLADGFEDAFLGIVRQFTKSCAAYDRRKCIEILMRDMSEDEAEEYFEFNVQGAWVGEHTPQFFEPLNFTKELEKL